MSIIIVLTPLLSIRSACILLLNIIMPLFIVSIVDKNSSKYKVYFAEITELSCRF